MYVALRRLQACNRLYPRTTQTMSSSYNSYQGHGSGHQGHGSGHQGHGSGHQGHGSGYGSRRGRRGGRGGGRGHGGGRGGGRGGPPAGLKGRDIGMWYAARSKQRKKEEEKHNRPVVTMDANQEDNIARILDDVRHLQPIGGDSQHRQRASISKQDAECRSFYIHPLNQDTLLDQQLLEEHESKSSNHQYAKMMEFRKKLPSYKMRQELLDLIHKNQVVVISGETGCGKTTQVPQFILDDFITSSKGSLCRAICTQPRRISAISVAERVAVERAENCGQNQSAGFQIRLEAKLPRRQGCILYCTNGILLKWLESDPLLTSVSHVVLDEVHERDIMSDFLLIILKDVLPKRPDLKIILMSATLNAEQFSQFFGGCPMVNIPGYTFPVKEYWLEDVLQITKYQPREQYQKKVPPWLKHRKKREQRLEEEREMEEYNEKFKEYITAMEETYSPDVIQSLSTMDHEAMDLDLMACLIRYIHLHKPEGAILVFVPGWDQISKLHDKLSGDNMFSSHNSLIIPLHSMMPTVNQRQVFERPPQGVRKIVIATNIAETSITIDDVVYVVDIGRVKERNFDVKNNISTLKPEWCSNAACRQRRGRSGRVQPGECYHMFSQLRASLMADYQQPEMLRTPLDELCLNIKSLKLGRIVPFISKALQCPSLDAVKLAITSLQQLNALDENEELTSLGYHLARLPVEPRIGKMILFGAMFCCLDPILTIAASLSFKDPFIIPLGKEKIADARRKDLARGCLSDHLMLVNAVWGWEDKSEGRAAENDYCWHNFMSGNTLKMLDNMKGQFYELLYNIGFLHNKSCKQPQANRNSENEQLIKAVLCAGLYPNIAEIKEGRYSWKKKMKRPAKFRTPSDGNVKVHPKSVNCDGKEFNGNRWMLYHLKLKSTGIFLHDTSIVEPYPLLFFGGKLQSCDEDGMNVITMDGLVKFHAPARIAQLVQELRHQMEQLLEHKITHPGITNWQHNSREGKIMTAIVDLFTMDGQRQQEQNWRESAGYRAQEEEEESEEEEDDDDGR
ncbi:LOW QUALITY PROTEIN: ATP-dependent DNA/RNA helicase DHX36-like [Amphiura filiformis]|uniref:LOW QUALITY PROTEIN: ATP-dependent DNA/RNA helicase DHX36-like n=1 Tax=Amphiura filiformis TaxID=82378 RepID=UPI003B2267EF